MGWNIKCVDKNCKGSWANNIVDLIKKHTDQDGWFLCSCGKKGHIKKSFKLQETRDTWKPYLRGVIPLADKPDDIYQPFVFLVSYEPNDDPVDVWFSYYKDLRSQAGGGHLKMGYGPGGPPVLNKLKVVDLLSRMKSLGLISLNNMTKLMP
jgi:hypothetical protein